MMSGPLPSLSNDNVVLVEETPLQRNVDIRYVQMIHVEEGEQHEDVGAQLQEYQVPYYPGQLEDLVQALVSPPNPVPVARSQDGQYLEDLSWAQYMQWKTDHNHGENEWVMPPRNPARRGSQTRRSSGGDSSEAPVAMLSQGGPGMVSFFFGSVTKPRFSGKESAWWNFKRDWEQYLSLGTSMLGRVPNDRILLESLREALDPINRMELMYAMETHGRLSYQDFWDQLREKYERDAIQHSCRAWEQTTLNLREGEDLTWNAWRTFMAAYRMRAVRYPDRTANEERSKILADLPPRWRAEVIKEESRRRSKRILCKVWGIGLDGDHLLDLLDDLQLGDPQVWPNLNCYWVEVTDREMQRRLLAWDGKVHHGVVIKAMPLELKMSAEDIFHFVEDRLRVEEDIREAERTCQIRSSGRDTPRRERDPWDNRSRSQSRDAVRWGKRPAPKQIQAISTHEDQPRPVSPTSPSGSGSDTPPSTKRGGGIPRPKPRAPSKGKTLDPTKVVAAPHVWNAQGSGATSRNSSPLPVRQPSAPQQWRVPTPTPTGKGGGPQRVVAPYVPPRPVTPLSARPSTPVPQRQTEGPYARCPHCWRMKHVSYHNHEASNCTHNPANQAKGKGKGAYDSAGPAGGRGMSPQRGMSPYRGISPTRGGKGKGKGQ